MFKQFRSMEKSKATKECINLTYAFNFYISVLRPPYVNALYYYKHFAALIVVI